MLPGFDVVDRTADGSAHANPQDPGQLERHGTELAGILAGSNGPGGLRGVAPGATILPIRVAGWQLDAAGRDMVFGRTDQVIAGLERAVDPNGDGDMHDAVRIALLGLAAPYAAFTDGPEAQAVQGALDLNTLVVAPAGNDGAAGPTFGSIAGPGGAPGALAVGATDARTELPLARVVLRRGLNVILDERLPLLGASAPPRSLSLAVSTPRSTRGLAGSQTVDYFSAGGESLVAGKAVVLPVGADPQGAAIAASRAGASAVVFYGAALPPGAFRVAEDETAPVVVVPTAVAIELLAAKRAGIDVGIAIGAEHENANRERGRVASFSSLGLAFDGGIKPDVAAPGIALATSEPGAAPDGSPLYGTVNGTSGAAATVAGAAALLAQMRPSLDGPSLDSLLVGYAQQGGAPATAIGAGTFRLGTSAVGEVAAQPTTLGFGIWQGAHWHATRTLVVRNVSTRRLQLSISAVAGGESEALRFTVVPNHLSLRVGRAARVQVTVRAQAAPAARLVTGVVQISPLGSRGAPRPLGALVRRGPAVAARPRGDRPVVVRGIGHESGHPERAGGHPRPRSRTADPRSLPARHPSLLGERAVPRRDGEAARPAARLLQLRHHRPRPDERAACLGLVRAAHRGLADVAPRRQAESRAGLLHDEVR